MADNQNQNISGLAQGIYSDLEKLIGQHLELLGSELRDELKKSLAAGVSLSSGAGAVALGSLCGAFSAVHLLRGITGMPLWLSYAIVGSLSCAAGAGLLATGAAQVSKINLVPEQTLQTVREELSSALP